MVLTASAREALIKSVVCARLVRIKPVHVSTTLNTNGLFRDSLASQQRAEEGLDTVPERGKDQRARIEL